jgi:MoxR-like ATPase
MMLLLVHDSNLRALPPPPPPMLRVLCSAILNSLLTLLNERLFDNGNQRLPVPLLCLIGASNELPESEELDALYDRFLIRRTVNQVRRHQPGC